MLIMPNATIPFAYRAFEEAFAFANEKHGVQRLPGSELPYISHVARVCFELLLFADGESYELEFMLVVAALHDTLEDTNTTEAELLERFGPKVLAAVKALSKDRRLPKTLQIEDSLNRILAEPKEVQLVKLADRIANLDRPPANWSHEKISEYRKTSELIWTRLKGAHDGLASRLQERISAYARYLQ